MKVRKSRVILLIVILLGGLFILRNRLFLLDSSFAYITGVLLGTCLFWNGGGTKPIEEGDSDPETEEVLEMDENEERVSELNYSQNCMNRSRQRALDRRNGVEE